MAELSARLLKLGKNPIREIAKLLDVAKSRKRIISFGGGSPSLPPAPEVIEELRLMAEAEPFKFSTYTGTKGLLTLREALVEDIRRDTGLVLDPEKEVTVTCGSEEGLMAALMALLNDGDEVIIANPSYPAYPETIKMVGGNVIWLPTSVDDCFQPDVERLKTLITDKTKAFIINTPDNPTGRMLDEVRAKAIVDLAVDEDFWLMIDEAYAHIVYEGSHVWISALPSAFERSIVYSSF
ncbi:MAG: pyridoxal phosphate-dependent aminotransferase, partial [Candidatus Bathyarchaeia archaeon]